MITPMDAGTLLSMALWSVVLAIVCYELGFCAGMRCAARKFQAFRENMATLKRMLER